MFLQHLLHWLHSSAPDVSVSSCPSSPTWEQERAPAADHQRGEDI